MSTQTAGGIQIGSHITTSTTTVHLVSTVWEHGGPWADGIARFSTFCSVTARFVNAKTTEAAVTCKTCAKNLDRV